MVGAVDVKTIRLFLASTAELREDHDAFERYLLKQNHCSSSLKIVRKELLSGCSITVKAIEVDAIVEQCRMILKI